MRQTKRRMPAITLPISKAFNYALVLNQKGKIFTSFRIVNLAHSFDVWSKDTSHAFLFLQNKIFHKRWGLSFTGMLTSEPVALLQQKTQSAGLWVSLW